jgi:hypothetical protein
VAAPSGVLAFGLLAAVRMIGSNDDAHHPRPQVPNRTWSAAGSTAAGLLFPAALL